MTLLCDVFGVHRSTYKYWARRQEQVNSKRLHEHALIKQIHAESGGSAGARTIAKIAMARGIKLTRYRTIVNPLNLLPGIRYDVHFPSI